MSARTSSNRDQAISTFLKRFARKDRVDDIVQNNAAIGVDGLVHFFTRAERRDDDRHFVFHTHLNIVVETVIGLVNDLVHRKWCRRAIRVLRVILCEFCCDPIKPLV